MKKLLTLSLAVLAGALTAQAQITAPTGGPDSYGYTWKTSAAAGGPTYRWVDIRNRGIEVNGLDDDNQAPNLLALPFQFPYYLGAYSQVRVASNGYLAFVTNNSAPANLAQPMPNIPNADGQRAFVAPFLADLNFSRTGVNSANPGRCYYLLNADSLIVSYVNVPFWERAAAGLPDFRGSNTFQVIISRLDSSVTFQYQAMDPTLPTPGAQSPNQAVIGIEDQTETLGLQTAVNEVPAAGTAVKYYRPRTTVFQFTDVAPGRFVTDNGSAFFALLGQPITVVSEVNNPGNQNATPFDLQIRITNRPGLPAAALYSQRITLPGLRAQSDTLVTFAQTYTPSTAAPSAGTGVFQVQSRTFLTADQNTSNDITRSMFVVVDTTSVPQYTLSYDDEPANNVIGFGAGVYFKPPYYPAEITSTEAAIVGANATANSDIKIRIYADNGPNGTAGTLLYADSIAQADVSVGPLPGVLNTVTLFQPVRINSGGFYISWVPDSLTTTFVGTRAPATANQAIPLSRNNFEVINNTFAPYRTTNENIMITATLRTRTALGAGEDRTGQLGLAPAYPNPASDRTTLGYTLSKGASVTVTVTDLLGRPVRTARLGQMPAGEHRYDLNTADMPAGVYTYSLQAGSVRLTRKLVVQH
jgi:Secretion system C-terminal sorting domain